MEDPKKNELKTCHHCGNSNLGLVSTQGEKHCTDCGATLKWFLEDNQKAAMHDYVGGRDVK